MHLMRNEMCGVELEVVLADEQLDFLVHCLPSLQCARLWCAPSPPSWLPLLVRATRAAHLHVHAPVVRLHALAAQLT